MFRKTEYPLFCIFYILFLFQLTSIIKATNVPIFMSFPTISSDVKK